MVRAAVAGQPGFAVDDREIRRSGVSYSIDTLTELRREHPQRSLCLLLGMDAFLGMPTWHRWREIFELCHVVVAHRPGWKAPITGPLGEVMVDRGTGSVRDLHGSIAGRIHVQAVTQLEIASTDLRALIMSGRDLRYLVPDAVRDLIQRTGCYAARNRTEEAEPTRMTTTRSPAPRTAPQLRARKTGARGAGGDEGGQHQIMTCAA